MSDAEQGEDVQRGADDAALLLEDMGGMPEAVWMSPWMHLHWPDIPVRSPAEVLIGANSHHASDDPFERYHLKAAAWASIALKVVAADGGRRKYSQRVAPRVAREVVEDDGCSAEDAKVAVDAGL